MSPLHHPHHGQGMAPAGLKTSEVTGHLLTQAAVIQRYLPVKITVEGTEGQAGSVAAINFQLALARPPARISPPPSQARPRPAGS